MINRILLVSVFIFFSLCKATYATDKKDEMKQYLNQISPVLTKVQITAINLSQRLVPLQGAIKQMDNYINTLNSLDPPSFMVKQHKTILLSFRKLRMGFYLLSQGHRLISVKLVARGRDLLRIAVKDILEFSKKEGLIKEKKEE